MILILYMNQGGYKYTEERKVEGEFSLIPRKMGEGFSAGEGSVESTLGREGEGGIL
jgi:hypothetical protein